MILWWNSFFFFFFFLCVCVCFCSGRFQKLAKAVQLAARHGQSDARRSWGLANRASALGNPDGGSLACKKAACRGRSFVVFAECLFVDASCQSSVLLN